MIKITNNTNKIITTNINELINKLTNLSDSWNRRVLKHTELSKKKHPKIQGQRIQASHDAMAITYELCAHELEELLYPQAVPSAQPPDRNPVGKEPHLK